MQHTHRQETTKQNTHAHTVQAAATCVNEGEGGAGGSVPEPDLAISSAAATGQQPMLVRGPGNGLDGRHMLPKAGNMRGGVCVPDEELVVIAAGC